MGMVKVDGLEKSRGAGHCEGEPKPRAGRGGLRRGNLSFASPYEHRDCFTSFASTDILTYCDFTNFADKEV